ncbi:uncharacterized protein LOC141651136 [Silene latifolia]|uniref:uncharacterized protein LOC141651136 n=1 Tax=Silene latifolia TaxID=37657 RepID=UPI003D77627E
MVDATAGHEVLTFFDAWSGYNQIKMHPQDQEKTAFMSERGIYCYKVMPFGLKNAGSTYQRLVNKMFKQQIGKTMEVYIDDMVVKSKKAGMHMEHLADTFQTLREFKMKLNPSKCSFGVSSGKFLGEARKKESLAITGNQDGEIWTLYIDGASNARGAGVGLVLQSPKGDMIVQAIRCEFKATNNEAEYEALILGMQMVSGLKVRNLRVYSDSLLVVNHVNNEYVARDPKMIAYLKIATERKSKFRTFKITQVPREQNVEADALATLGSTFQPAELSNIPITHVLTPAIQGEPDQRPMKEDVHTQCAWCHSAQGARTLVSAVGQQDADWRVPYLNWLRDGTLPEDRKEAQIFRIKASRYIMIDNILFRKSLAGPCLRCLSKEEAETVLQDVHSGEYENHAGGRSLSNKILRQGYFWPTMRADAVNHAKRCESCQKAAPAIHQPAEPMHPIISPWSFMMWGMDIVGKLPRAPGNRVYMLAMTDYLSKWI